MKFCCEKKSLKFKAQVKLEYEMPTLGIEIVINIYPFISVGKLDKLQRLASI